MTMHFLRIDDIGKWPYQEAIVNDLIDQCSQRGIKCILGVIPNELDVKTADYLKKLISEDNPKIELVAHGFKHDFSEFSESQSVQQQQETLTKAIEVFNTAFDQHPMGFIAPYHMYCEATFKALDNTGFTVMSNHFKPGLDGKIFYGLGRAMKKNFLLGKKVSYHTKVISGTSLNELSVSIELARSCIHKPAAELEQEYERVKKYTNVIGFIVHHQVMQEYGSYLRFLDFLDLCQVKGWQFDGFNDIHKKINHL